MRRLIISFFTGAVLLWGAAPSYSADTITIDPAMTPGQFSDLADDLTRLAWFNPMTPAKPLGVPGFFGSIEMQFAGQSSGKHWTNAAGHTPNPILLSRVHLMAGLPGDTDIGIISGSAADTNARIIGIEGRHAIMDGSLMGPEFGIRGSVTTVSGLGEAELTVFSFGAHISKKLTVLHPYAGVEYVTGRVAETSDAVAFTDETTSMLGVSAGFHLTLLPFTRLGFDATQTGGESRFGAGFALTF